MMAESKKSTKKWNPYQFMIVFMIGVFVVFSVWSAKQASSNGTNVTDSDYYSKGLRYNKTLVEKRAASVLGWQVETELKGRDLQLQLSDKESKPVKGATGFAELYFDASGTTTMLDFVETVPGYYQLSVPTEISGEVRARLELERDGAKIHRQVLLTL